MRYVIGFTKEQARKIEKIFREFDMPYFTDGSGDWTTFDDFGRVLNDKVYVLLTDIKDHIINVPGLRQALKIEFSNVDIPDWIDANKENYRILKEL